MRKQCGSSNTENQAPTQHSTDCGPQPITDAGLERAVCAPSKRLRPPISKIMIAYCGEIRVAYVIVSHATMRRTLVFHFKSHSNAI
jgi:hypothetical protein